MPDQQNKSLDVIKAVYDDGVVEINGHEYKFLATTHSKRKQVFAFFSSVQHEIAKSDFSFIANDRFVTIEKVIGNMVTYDGNLLNKCPKHWDEYPEDYLKFITTAMGVISYPFLKGNLTN